MNEDKTKEITEAEAKETEQPKNEITVDLRLSDCLTEFLTLQDYLEECDGQGIEPNRTIVLTLVNATSKKLHFFEVKHDFKINSKYLIFAENYDEFLELIREEGGTA